MKNRRLTQGLGFEVALAPRPALVTLLAVGPGVVVPLLFRFLLAVLARVVAGGLRIESR
jgi:hypothetical protein